MRNYIPVWLRADTERTWMRVRPEQVCKSPVAAQGPFMRTMVWGSLLGPDAVTSSLCVKSAAPFWFLVKLCSERCWEEGALKWKLFIFKFFLPEQVSPVFLSFPSHFILPIKHCHPHHRSELFP